MKRLLIVADHSFVAQTIRLALRQTAGFEVVGFVDGSAEISPQVTGLRPDVVVVDDMQELDHAIARLNELKLLVPEAKCLLLTMLLDGAWIERAFDAGADAAISKTVHPVSLGTLLREISRGTVVHRMPKREISAADHECPLTARELEILVLVAQGYTNNRIARQLWVTEQTVKFHLSNTYRKLGVANRTEASRYAHVHNLTAPRVRIAS
jgi:DNA-binding NarL/FixJ family response regulator